MMILKATGIRVVKAVAVLQQGLLLVVLTVQVMLVLATLPWTP